MEVRNLPYPFLRGQPLNNAHVQPFISSVNLLFGAVLVTGVVVVCLSSLFTEMLNSSLLTRDSLALKELGSLTS